MYRVVYLPTARRQLEDAVMYIAVDLAAPDAAMALADAVDSAVQKLREMPYRFPIYHTLYAMKHEIRFFPVKNYNVYYVVREETKTVEIWRVLHRLQNQKRN
ncbi:MAG: type II toxin-antitoxin system RelE/ParE family toxin [Clostridia bacterium]|nr:type II toxin-antitoxin system RelE/ParE family toxin [Clostridia bacterium]